MQRFTIGEVELAIEVNEHLASKAERAAARACPCTVLRTSLENQAAEHRANVVLWKSIRDHATQRV